MVDPTVYRYLKDASSQLPARKLVVDHGDNKSTYISGSLVSTLVEQPNFDENLTTYTLYPYELNQPPIIIESVSDASEPKIYNSVNWIEGQKAMYQNNDGAVIVTKGTTIKLRVKAQQPSTLNVENGIPTVLQGTKELTYTWTFNGVEIPSNTDDKPENLTVAGPELEIINTGIMQAGAYACLIANDAGSTSTQPIILQVFDPYASQTDFFRKNVVTNSTFTDGVSGWSNVIGEVQKRSFITSTRENLNSLAQLKKSNNVSSIGYAPEMLEPQADTITFPNIKKLEDDTFYDLSSLLDGSGGYITRSDLTYGATKGKKTVVAYQDLDLSSIQDYIAGKVWGVDGVKAYFSCYLGNGVSRFVPTEDVLTKEERGDLSKYWKLTPKLSLENILLTGLPYVDESLTVYIQEYFDGELLTSHVYNPITGQTIQTNAVKIVDPVTSALNSVQNGYAFTEDGLVMASTNEPAGKIAKAYQQLYGNKANYYANGQVIRQQELIFNQLNTRTNRIRISLKFELNTIRFDETEQVAIDNSRMLELVSWERAFKKGLIETGDYALAKIRTRNGYNQDTAITKAFLDASISRALATGFIFVTNPIVSNDGYTKGNNIFLSNIKQTSTQLDYNQRVVSEAQIFQPENTDFVTTFLGTSNKFRQLVYEIATKQEPRIQPTPSWASPLDWRDTTLVWDATIKVSETNQATRQTEQVQTIEYGPFEKAIEDPTSRYYNELDTSNIADLRSGLQHKAITIAKKVGGNKTAASNQITQLNVNDHISTSLNDMTSPTTLDLRKWIDPNYVAQIKNSVKDGKELPLENTFEVEFHLYHLNNGSLEKIGTVTKYMLAGKTIKLTLADFISENSLPSSHDYASKTFTGDRNVYVAPYSIKHVFKLDYWKAVEHQIPINNLKQRTQALIDNLTWESEDYRYSDELKGYAEDATVNYNKPNGDPLDHTKAGAIQWMINELIRLQTETVLWTYTDSFRKLTEKLKTIRDEEGYQTPPPKTIIIQNTDSDIQNYNNRTGYTVSTGLIDTCLGKNNSDVITYTYRINSFGKQQIV